MEMKRKLRFAGTLAAVLLVAACTDGGLTPVGDTPLEPLGLASDPNNGAGECLYDDENTWSQFTSGNFSFNPSNPEQNCTSNDVEIANAVLDSAVVEDGADNVLGTPDDVWSSTGPYTCTVGEDIRIAISATLQKNPATSSPRSDIGLWLSTDGSTLAEGGGRVGECNHFNLPEDTPDDVDNDQCGDMVTQGSQETVDLGAIIVECAPDAENNLRIANCLAWKVPGDEGTFPTGSCPAFTTTGTGQNQDHDLIEGTDGFRAGTLPGNTSKCNCDDFVVPVTVLQDGKLEVAKECVPTGDAGKFDLLIDGSNSFADDVSCGGSTGEQVVGAGTSADPGAIHTVAELAGTGTSLADYNSTWECTLDGSSTVINQCGTGTNKATFTSACSGSGDGPESVLVNPDQDIVCTFTNERKAQLRIAKATLPDGNTTEFTFTPTGWNSGSTFTRIDNQAAFASGNLNPGAYSVVETVPSGWELTGRACVFTGTSDVKTHTNTTNGISVTLAAGEDVTCTFTNTAQAKLRVEKETIPDGATQEFTFTPTGWNGGTTFTRIDNQAAFSSAFLTPNTSYSVAETVPSGWDLTGRACRHTVGGAVKTHTNITLGVQVNLLPGEDITCKFTNTQRATIELEKRESGSTTLTRTWTFELRTGTTTTDAGTLVASASNTPPDGTITFAGSFAPGNYQLCETGMPAGWTNNIPSPPGFTPLGGTPEGGDNSVKCVNVTLSAGQHLTEIVTGLAFIDNTPPPTPGGEARTIGYWKNHSSCNKNGGKQHDRLVAQGDADKTLDFYLPSHTGIFPFGDITSMTCEQAFNILSKSSFDGTKRANDAAYGLAAQLLAAKLNVAAGADPLCIQPVIDAAQDLLADSPPDGVNFTGTGPYLGPKSGNPLRSYATALAGILDDYNNNDLVCPVVLPTP